MPLPLLNIYLSIFTPYSVLFPTYSSKEVCPLLGIIAFIVPQNLLPIRIKLHTLLTALVHTHTHKCSFLTPNTLLVVDQAPPTLRPYAHIRNIVVDQSLPRWEHVSVPMNIFTVSGVENVARRYTGKDVKLAEKKTVPAWSTKYSTRNIWRLWQFKTATVKSTEVNWVPSRCVQVKALNDWLSKSIELTNSEWVSRV